MTFPEAAAYLARSTSESFSTIESRFLTLMKKSGTDFAEYVNSLSFEYQDRLIAAAERRLNANDF